MKGILLLVHFLVTVILTLLILLQGRGAGLGSSFGGAGELYRSKRGFERILFMITLLMIAFFFLTSIINFLTS